MSNTEHRRGTLGYLQKEIEDAFSELIHVRWGNIEPSWRPAVDLYEQEDAYIIVADLPGIPPSDIQMEALQCCVTICGIRETLVSHSEGHSVITERARGRFCRRIDLPGPVDPEKAKAEFKEGVYQIFLPKKEEHA